MPPGRDTNIGAKRAREARAELGLDDGAPLRCLLSTVEEDLRLPVVVAQLPEAIAGCCWRKGDATLLWVNGRQVVARQRFTLAHELGHVRCGHDADLPPETSATLAGFGTTAVEVQANAFAAELLAPVAAVREWAPPDPSLVDVVRLAAEYGISTIAALYRLNSAECAPRFDQLKAEIDAGDHIQVWDHLRPPDVDDVLASLGDDDLPRLSPALAGSALDRMVRGEASVDAASQASGGDTDDLVRAAGTIGV